MSGTGAIKPEEREQRPRINKEWSKPPPHNHFTALCILSGTTRVSQYQKKHSPTHTYCVINHPYLLLPSNTIHGILTVQSTCLTVFFHNLSPSFLWSTSCPGTLYKVTRTLLTTSMKCSITFRASKLLLISAPSILVWRSALEVSAPRSFPVTTAILHSSNAVKNFSGFFANFCYVCRAL